MAVSHLPKPYQRIQVSIRLKVRDADDPEYVRLPVGARGVQC